MPLPISKIIPKLSTAARTCLSKYLASAAGMHVQRSEWARCPAEYRSRSRSSPLSNKRANGSTATSCASLECQKGRQISRLMVFFSVVYVAEGTGQTGGLIAQPLNYFLKETYGWSPVQVTAYLTVLNLPWIMKPLYGIVSDFLPLFGYRRKTYLVVANAAAAGAYCWVTQITAPAQLVFALLLSAYGMA